MNNNFWDHFLNAVSALETAQRQSAPPPSAQRAKKKAKKQPAPEGRAAFGDQVGSPGADCCITKKRFKLGSG